MSRMRALISSLNYGNRFVSVFRLLLGILFLYSGFMKLLNPYAFAGIIGQYNILPDVLAPYAALLVPCMELVAGGLLLLGFRIRAASFLLFLMMIAFSIAIAINLIRGASFHCGCLELGWLGIDESISLKLILRNIVILGLLWLIFNARKHPLSLESLIEREKLSHI